MVNDKTGTPAYERYMICITFLNEKAAYEEDGCHQYAKGFPSFEDARRTLALMQFCLMSRMIVAPSF